MLRFRCTPEVFAEIKAAAPANSVTAEEEASHALYGRYNVSLRLNFKQFNCLYPLLCSFRLFKKKIVNPVKEDDPAEYRKTFCCGDAKQCKKCPVSILRRELCQGTACATAPLNIRFMLKNGVNNALTVPAASKLDARTKRIGEVKKKTNTLLRAVNALRRYVFLLPQLNFQFEETLSVLEDLIRLYSNMGVQIDSYVNWKVFQRYAACVIDTVHTSEKALYTLLSEEKTEKAKELTALMLEILRHSIDGLEIFSKLCQSVNSHSYTEPNYEILTQVNAQKLVLSHSEFLYTMAKAYHDYSDRLRSSSSTPVTAPKRFLLPVVVPHLNTMSVQATRLFPHGFIETPAAAPVGNVPSYEHLILMRVSTFQNYLRIFDTIPMVTHELAHFSHHVRGGDRNAFLIDRTCRRIVELAVIQLVRISDPRYLINPNSAPFKAIVDLFHKEFVKVLLSEPHNWENLYFQELQKFIYRELSALFSRAVERDPYAIPLRDAGQQFVEVCSRYCNVTEDATKELEAFQAFTGVAAATPEAVAFEEYLEAARAIRNGTACALLNQFAELGGSEENAKCCIALNFLRNNPKATVDSVLAFLEDDGARALYPRGDLSAALQDIFGSFNMLRLAASVRTQPSARELKEDSDAFFRQLLPKLEKELGALLPKANTDPLPFYDARLYNLVYGAITVFQSDTGRWWRVSHKELKDSVGFVFGTYNEFCSDVAMCLMLRLDAPAYLLALTLSQMRDKDGSINESLALRAKMTLESLGLDAAEQDHQIRAFIDRYCALIFSKLQTERIHPVAEEVRDAIREEMLNRYAGRAAGGASEHRTRDNIMDYLMETSVQDAIRADYLTVAESVFSANALYMRLDIFMRILEEMAKYPALTTLEKDHVAQIRSAFHAECGEKGITSLWENALNKRERDIIKKIADYYKTPDDSQFTPLGMLEDALDFVTEFYYRNRFRVMKEQAKMKNVKKEAGV